MTNDYGNLELHMVLLQAMKDIDKICRENNLKYYLYAGSLLGAMNFKGFIPWDDDIDIVMFPKDYRKLKNIIEKDYDQYYGIYTFDNTPEWYSMMSKIVVKGTEIKDNQNSSFPIFIDVSELHSIPDSRLLRFIQRKKIEIYNLALSVLSGAVVLNSLKSKMTIGVVAKLGKNKLGNLLRRELVRYDNNMETEWVGIMCNTLTRNPYTGMNGYLNDMTLRENHKKYLDVPFEDTKFMTILEPDKDLERRYGKNWDKPYSVEKRVTKHDVKSYNISSEVRKRIGL